MDSGPSCPRQSRATTESAIWGPFLKIEVSCSELKTMFESVNREIVRVWQQETTSFEPHKQFPLESIYVVGLSNMLLAI